MDHGDGLRTTYQPVTARVARGDVVRQGDVLGMLETGAGHCFPATCLHWGLRRGSTYLDPLTWLGAVRVRLLPVWSLPGPPVAVRPRPTHPRTTDTHPTHLPGPPADASPRRPSGQSSDGRSAASRR